MNDDDATSTDNSTPPPRDNPPRIIEDPEEARTLAERARTNRWSTPPRFDALIENMRLFGVLSPDEPRPDMYRLRELIADLGVFDSAHEHTPGHAVVLNARRRALGLGRPGESAALDRVANILMDVLLLEPGSSDGEEFTELPPDEQERYLRSRKKVSHEERAGILSNGEIFDPTCAVLIAKHRPDGSERLKALHRAYLDGDGVEEVSIEAMYFAEAAFAVLAACDLDPKPLPRTYHEDDPFHPARLASNLLTAVVGIAAAPSIEVQFRAFSLAAREHHRMVLALYERRILSNAASVKPMPKESSHYAVTGKRDRIEQWCRARVENLRAEGRPLPSARALASRARAAEREQKVDQVPGESTIRGWIREMKLLASPVSTSHEPSRSSGHGEGEP